LSSKVENPAVSSVHCNRISESVILLRPRRECVREILQHRERKFVGGRVGLDFYTTSPAFLEEFLSVIRIGNALQGGTFHPKLYLFETADRLCAASVWPAYSKSCVPCAGVCLPWSSC
jgi:hypothetical protein